MLTEESKRKLIAGVDAGGDTCGMPILVIDDDAPYWLRRLTDGTSRTVLFRIVYEHSETSKGAELMSLGFNVAGTACAWIGAIGFSAAAPVTGGASAPLAYVSAAAAGAGTVQTVASGMRVYNEFSGNHQANVAQDNDSGGLSYLNTMRACDILQLVSAGGGIKTALKAKSNLKAASIPFSRALAGNISFREQKALAKVVSTEGGTAFTRSAVNSERTAIAVKQQILGSISSAISGLSSATGGVIKEVQLALCGTIQSQPTTTQGFVGPVLRR